MSASRWYYRAECQDCPTTFNEEWGYDEKVSWEHKELPLVIDWADMHHTYTGGAEHGGHKVKVLHCTTIHFDTVDVNEPAMRKLIGLEPHGKTQEEEALFKIVNDLD